MDIKKNFFAFGSIGEISVKVENDSYDIKKLNLLLDKIRDCISNIEKNFSPDGQGGDIAEINKRAGRGYACVKKETYDFLSESKKRNDMPVSSVILYKKEEGKESSYETVYRSFLLPGTDSLFREPVNADERKIKYFAGLNAGGEKLDLSPMAKEKAKRSAVEILKNAGFADVKVRL